MNLPFGLMFTETVKRWLAELRSECARCSCNPLDGQVIQQARIKRIHALSKTTGNAPSLLLLGYPYTIRVQLSVSAVVIASLPNRLAQCIHPNFSYKVLHQAPQKLPKASVILDSLKATGVTSEEPDVVRLKNDWTQESHRSPKPQPRNRILKPAIP